LELNIRIEVSKFSDSESGFKRLLKTHLFNNCFNVA